MSIYIYIYREREREPMVGNEKSTLRVRKYTAMTGFVRISRIYLISGFTLVADQQFLVECEYK